LRILLLALAVIDDVGAILVIALFYSAGLEGVGFVVLALGMLAILALQAIGVRSPFAYVAPGAAIWAGAYAGGIHPTLAGVVVGFMTPVKAWYGKDSFLDHTEEGVRTLRSEDAQGHHLLSHLETLKTANREAVSPVERLQHLLHGWVAFGVMPLFAFANAGVPLGEISFEGDAFWLFWGVTLGLLVGKPVGVVALSWLAVRVRVADLPRGVHWTPISVVGMVAGIGFTMALFIADLAFPPGPLLETSKLAILCGSFLAGVISLIVGYRILKPNHGTGAATTHAEAEASTPQ
jgi:NhaA family Na+:H+ antiporter